MVRRAKGPLLQAISIERDTPRTLGTQISAGLRQLILTGAIAAKERLPATRTLALELGVARTTVVEAYERLVVEGIAESRVGAGTFVSGVLDSERPAALATVECRAPAPVRLSKTMAAASTRMARRLNHGAQPFTTAMPAFDGFPVAQWSSLMARHWRKPRFETLGHAEAQGLSALRKAIAAHLRAYRGIDCDWRQLFIVAGAQQAFHLIGMTLVDVGDKVWFEEPGAIGARNTLLMAGADLIPVPVDDSGLDVETGLRRSRDFRLAFVTPSHQQPMGSKLSLERRFALLKAAEACDGWIIEDDWDGELCFSGRPLPTLKSIDAHGRVIYVGTFSKTMFPALRLGFLLAPERLADTFRTSLETFTPAVPTCTQAALGEFIAEGHFATHIRRMRKIYAERHQCLIDCGKRQLARWLDIVPTTTGMHTVALLKPGLDADRIAAELLDGGVTVAPLGRFCIEQMQRQGFVLGFSAFSPAAIEGAVERMARIFEDMKEDALVSRSALPACR